MRNAPRIWRGGSKAPRRASTLPPPECHEVTIEVLGVSPGLQRIDIVASAEPAQQALPETQPVTEGERWESIEEALASTTTPRSLDPWHRLNR